MKGKALARVLTFVCLWLVSVRMPWSFVSANFIPEEPPPGIRIESDGTVKGTDKIIRTGDTYIFAGDIDTTIVVLRDSIVLDGSGYTLRGNGDSAGIFLQDRCDVTIKNLYIMNFTYGIKSVWGDLYTNEARRSSYIFGNNISGNTVGIYISSSTPHLVHDNLIVNNKYGVSLHSSKVVFRDNRFEDNDFSIYGNVYNDIDASNTVNGKPVYYWIDQHDRVVPSDAGLVVLYNCKNITVQNLTLTNNGQGILLCCTTETKIAGNVLTNNIDGIALFNSIDNFIYGNRIVNNSGYGIYLFSSSSNIISENRIIANRNDGVNFEGSVNNTVSENLIMENKGNGIFFRNIQGSIVIRNNITMNANSGIGFGFGPKGLIKENYISKNRIGIWLSNAEGNTITLNMIVDNDDWGIELEGSQKNNIIHHNNFINNAATRGLQARVAEIWSYPALGINVPPGQPLNQSEMPKLVPGAANVWDDGKEGNYWSDYKTRYHNASMVAGTKIWDMAYVINENNADNCPLMEPLEIFADLPQELPSPEPSQETESQQDSQKTETTGGLAISAIILVFVSFGLLLCLLKYRGNLIQADAKGLKQAQ